MCEACGPEEAAVASEALGGTPGFLGVAQQHFEGVVEVSGVYVSSIMPRCWGGSSCWKRRLRVSPRRAAGVIGEEYP